VGINPRLIDPRRPGTSKLDWRYLEHNKIDWNELQICTNSQKGTETKMTGQMPYLGLVANKYTKLGKTSEVLFLSYMKIPL
jgi:hypothetical protein